MIVMAKRNVLLCHVMKDLNIEVGTVKTKLYAQEFQWKKRMWPIDKTAVPWKDRKGNYHMFFDVNESDGTIRYTFARKDNIIDDKCIQCGGMISIDAKNTWDLLKRKTINSFWGIDQSHIILLMILGIIALACIAGVFYLVGENKKLQDIVTNYIKNQVAATFLTPIGVLHYAS
jgi:hypothetical protein